MRVVAHGNGGEERACHRAANACKNIPPHTELDFFHWDRIASNMVLLLSASEHLSPRADSTNPLID
jgi:hypothetical protein